MPPGPGPLYTRLMRFRSLFLSVLVLLLAVACTVNPAGRQAFTGLMSRADEIDIGKKEHPKILEQFGGVYNDPALKDYIRRLGNNLVQVSEEKGLPFTFTVLNSSDVNAFALPGGYVYITRGLLALAENESEVVGVLAHEIGHVTARHSAERYSQAMAASFGFSILGAIGSAYGVPSSVGDVASIGMQAMLRSYSRDQELESDKLGIRYMAKAGYSVDGSVSFFEKLKAHSAFMASLSGDGNPEEDFSIMATHPRTSERINEAIRLTREAKTTGVSGPSRASFLKKIDGMVYGDAPDEGVRRGRVFAHPGLRITFEVPEGFALFNSPSKVMARNKTGAIILYDMEARKKAKAIDDLRRYLVSDWGRKLGLKNIDTITINGMKAITGDGRIKNKKGEARDARLVVIQEAWGKVHRLAFLTIPATTKGLSPALRRTTYSFRTISRDEAADIQPLRLSLKTVGRSDTATTLAGSLPFGDRAANQSLFRIINGLGPDAALRPGTVVKLIR